MKTYLMVVLALVCSMQARADNRDVLETAQLVQALMGDGIMPIEKGEAALAELTTMLVVCNCGVEICDDWSSQFPANFLNDWAWEPGENCATGQHRDPILFEMCRTTYHENLCLAVCTWRTLMCDGEDTAEGVYQAMKGLSQGVFTACDYFACMED